MPRSRTCTAGAGASYDVFVRRYLRTAAVLAAMIAGLGTSTCRFSSNPSKKDHGDDEGDHAEVALVVPWPVAPPMILLRRSRF